MGQRRSVCANAGILRDKSFTKMEVADFAKVLDVHLTGTFYCCKAVWAGMRDRNYGRIVVTTSSSGLFGISARPITARRKPAWSA